MQNLLNNATAAGAGASVNLPHGPDEQPALAQLDPGAATAYEVVIEERLASALPWAVVETFTETDTAATIREIPRSHKVRARVVSVSTTGAGITVGLQA